MKTKILSLTAVLCLTFASCSQEDQLYVEPQSNVHIKGSTSGNQEYEVPRTLKSENQVVVRYKKNFTTQEKQDLRSQFYVKKHSTCSCGDDSLELWFIDENIIDVESAVTNLPRTGDVEGNYQFDLFLTNKDGFVQNQVHEIEDSVGRPSNRKTVNIAVIDTGVDYDYFSRPFLYNTTSRTGCSEEVSGWDFVNGDADIRDDHLYGHGTLVTKIITSELKNQQIDHRILALKAFDKNGKGSYWDIVCAMNYLTKHANKIDIVNMSFGWYDISGQTILESMIRSLAKNTLFVASAGNAGVDTDNSEDTHFPSGYTAGNLLAVGGFVVNDDLVINPEGEIEQGIGLAENSNFGTTSIDMVAPFDTYELELVKPGQPAYVVSPEGTSFATALVTAKAAILASSNHLFPVSLKTKILGSANFSDVMLLSTLTGKVLLKE